MTGIYIHVPFCGKKCPYCDFFSESFSKDNEEKFVRAVMRDIGDFPAGISADTIYFGGGTPSLLSAGSISEIIDAAGRKFSLAAPEITIEANPSTVNSEKLAAYKDMGVNRLSFGVQSANDGELRLLGRIHSFKRAKEAVMTAREQGFENISCDIMTGLPGQSKDDLLRSIEEITSLPVTHISNYMLKIEKNTPFDNEDFIKTMPDDDTAAELYLFMVRELESRGFKQYEISNFSKAGFESRHNLKYWQCEEYIGFGPSAHSCYGGKRYYIRPDLEEYLSGIPEYIVTDDSPCQADEKIMLGLRLSHGISLRDFPEIEKKAEAFINSGLMKRNGDRVALTPEGFLVSNSIISELAF